MMRLTTTVNTNEPTIEMGIPVTRRNTIRITAKTTSDVNGRIAPQLGGFVVVCPGREQPAVVG